VSGSPPFYPPPVGRGTSEKDIRAATVEAKSTMYENPVGQAAGVYTIGEMC